MFAGNKIVDVMNNEKNIVVVKESVKGVKFFTDVLGSYFIV